MSKAHTCAPFWAISSLFCILIYEAEFVYLLYPGNTKSISYRMILFFEAAKFKLFIYISDRSFTRK